MDGLGLHYFLVSIPLKVRLVTQIPYKNVHRDRVPSECLYGVPIECHTDIRRFTLFRNE